MMARHRNSDASFYYYENASVDVASIDSSAVCGNLADAMRDAVVILSETLIVEASIVYPPIDDETNIEGRLPRCDDNS